jgi:hypothetical protein
MPVHSSFEMSSPRGILSHRSVMLMPQCLCYSPNKICRTDVHLPHSCMYILLEPRTLKENSRRSVWHLTREPEARSL